MRKDKIHKILFKLCTTDKNFLKLIQIYFTAPVLELQMIQYYH